MKRPSPNTEYIFTIPARRFAPVGEKDNTNNYSKEVSFSFTTLDTNLKLVKISPADDKASEHRTNGRSGTVVLTYNQAISKASDALPSMVSVDGKSTATVTGPVISGSTLTYEYTGAQYDTPYNFTLPEARRMLERECDFAQQRTRLPLHDSDKPRRICL